MGGTFGGETLKLGNLLEGRGLDLKNLPGIVAVFGWKKAGNPYFCVPFGVLISYTGYKFLLSSVG
jgi:hypothetical protein